GAPGSRSSASWRPFAYEATDPDGAAREASVEKMPNEASGRTGRAGTAAISRPASPGTRRPSGDPTPRHAMPLRPGARWSRSLQLVVAAEDLGHARVLEHRAERRRDQRRDGEHPELGERFLLGDRHGVRHDDLLDRRLLQQLHGLAGK